MKICKKCRHYRPSDLPLWLAHTFARCSNQKAFMRGAFVSIERKYDLWCGPSARFFEPLPLGRLHGIDWDRAAKIAETLSEMREFEATHDQPCHIGVVDGTPSLATSIVVDISNMRLTPRARFTVAEYLAALTTDYCRAQAAE
jgi:hypothetical protein